jgi:hypothetical protein
VLGLGSFISEEAAEVDAPASGANVVVVVVVVAGTVVVVVVVVVVVAGTVVVVVVVVVAGTVVVVGAVVVCTVIEMSESGASLLHVAAVTYIEITPTQTATFVDR